MLSLQFLMLSVNSHYPQNDSFCPAVIYTTAVPLPKSTLLLYVASLNVVIDFQNSFVYSFSSKFVVKSLNITPHLRRHR